MSALWTGEEAVKATGGELTAAFSVSGVSIDTRTLEPGDLFVALDGDNSDGHAYVGKAFEAGAAAALVSRPTDAMRAAGGSEELRGGGLDLKHGLAVEDAQQGDGDLGEAVRRAAKRRAELRVEQSALSAINRRLAHDLVNKGLSRRDAALALDVSATRVAQLLEA